MELNRKKYLHPRPSSPTSSSQGHQYCNLANILRGVASDVKVGVFTARGLADTGVVDPESERNVSVIREFTAGRETDLSTPVDSAGEDINAVAVLDEYSIVACVGNIDIFDLGAAGLRDAEEATSTTARDEFVDPDVSVVAAIKPTVLVCEAEGCVASAGSDVVSINEADPGVGHLLEQQTALAHVTRNDLVDVKAIDVPGLHGVARGTGHVNNIHIHIVVGSIVALEADAHPAAEVHSDLSE